MVSNFQDKTGKMSLQACSDEIMFQYCYPRLDVNVTKGLNHLLKSPFCIHPKTGTVYMLYRLSGMSQMRK